MEKSFISLKNINKIYPNGLHAVHDFSLEIKPHEFIVFVGPSGCGKSTTLRMIAGLEDITSGELYMNGRFANQLTPKDRDIAMVFQSYALYPHMSVYNNLAFGLKMRGTSEIKKDKEGNEIYFRDEKEIKSLQKAIASMEKDIVKADKALQELEQEKNNPIYAVELANIETSKKVLIENKKDAEERVEYLKEHDIPKMIHRKFSKAEIKERVEKAAEILEIKNYLNSKPREMSGGQRQRVALGRAIVRNANIFLMDEPLSNLDAKLRVNMRSEIVALHNKINTTTIYVTHDQTEAMTMASRIVVMKDGYIQQIGTPKEIYNNPANTFVATFIGSPAMNMFDVTYDNGVITFEKDKQIKLPKKIQDNIKDYYARNIKESEEELEILNNKLAHFDLSTLKGKELKFYVKQKEEMSEEASKLSERLNDFKQKINDNKFELILGIRPEDIHQSKKESAFKLDVQIPELLGNKYYVHSQFAGKDLVSEIVSRDEILAGDKISVEFDVNAMHLFDSLTKRGIC